MVNPIVGYFEDDQVALDRAIDTDIAAAEEADRADELAENDALFSAEEAEIDPEEAPFCCEECVGQENLFATQRSVR